MESSFCENFNEEWERWTQDRKEAKDWSLALPLICLEIYFHRRILDCTGYFGGGNAGGGASGSEDGAAKYCGVLQDPFQGMKLEALEAALSSDGWHHTLAFHLGQTADTPAALSLRNLWSPDPERKNQFFAALGEITVPAFFEKVQTSLHAALTAALWGNRGDLALAPGDRDNTQEAKRIAKPNTPGGGDKEEVRAGKTDKHLLVDETAAMIEHLFETGKAGGGAEGRENLQGTGPRERKVDIILDNSGIELLCDMLLAHVLLAFGVVDKVRLHAKVVPPLAPDA